MRRGPLFRRLRYACASLATLLALSVCGCVFIPIGERSIADEVGGPSSGKPIQLGASTRRTVLTVLGEPERRTQRDAAFGYVHSRRVGYWFPFSPGPCGLAGPGEWKHDEYLVIEFDSGGVARKKTSTEQWDRFVRQLEAADAAPNAHAAPLTPH